MFRFLFPFSLQLQLPVCFQQYTQFHLSWTLFIISHCTAKCWWSFILPISFKFQSQAFSLSSSRTCMGGKRTATKKLYNRIFSIMWYHIHDRQYNAMIESEREYNDVGEHKNQIQRKAWTLSGIPFVFALRQFTSHALEHFILLLFLVKIHFNSISSAFIYSIMVCVCVYVLVCECVYVHFIHIVCKSGSWNSALYFLLEFSFLFFFMLTFFFFLLFLLRFS